MDTLRYDAALTLIQAIDSLSEHASRPVDAFILDQLEIDVRRVQDAYARLAALHKSPEGPNESNVVYLD